MIFDSLSIILLYLPLSTCLRPASRWLALGSCLFCPAGHKGNREWLPLPENKILNHFKNRNRISYSYQTFFPGITIIFIFLKSHKHFVGLTKEEITSYHTPLTLLADAILHALIMMRSSIKLSLISPQPDWTMYTSSPRTDSPISTLNKLQ